jgi:hypothetical protein
VTPATIEQYRAWVARDVLDPVNFVRAGFMHNASYSGGFCGLAIGMSYMWYRIDFKKC